MKKVYVVVNGKNTKVYTNKEKAEAEAKKVNYYKEMAGSNEGYAYVVETEVVE